MTKQTETNEEKVALLQSVKGTPQEAEVMTELWKQNGGLVKAVVRKLTGLSENDPDFEDMTQQAYFGFRAAVYSFDLARGIRFSSYACKRIEWELCRYYERNGYTAHIPAYMKKRLREVLKKKKQLESEAGRSVSYETALRALGLSETAIAGTLNAIRKLETASLDRYISDDMDGITLLDTLSSDEDIEDSVLDQEWHRELHKLLMNALQDIPVDIRETLVRQFFHGVPIHRIAEESGQSRQTLWNKKVAAFLSIRTGKHGKELAEYMPTVSAYERAKRRIKQDREAVERLQLTDTERGLLIL